MHAQAVLGAVRDGRNLGDAERRCVGSEKGMRTADLIEQGEDFNLRFDLFGHSFDDQIGHARGFFHRAGIFNASKGGLGFVFFDFAQFNRLIEIAANLAFRFAEAGGKNVF